MRLRHTILILQIFTFLVVVAIVAWQLTTLPSLRFQIKSGLHNSLEKIADQGAKGLDEHYSQEVLKGSRFLADKLKASDFSPKNLDNVKVYFRLVAASQPLSNAWLFVLSDTVRNQFRTWEYKTPSRYRPDTEFSGGWRTNTELSDFVEDEMNQLLQPYQTVDSFARGYWASAADSNIFLVNNKAFNADIIIGHPVFDQNRSKLLGFVFNQTDNWYLENVFVRDYFNNYFKTGQEEWEGINRKYLQVGVFSEKGNTLIYNSVAYGRKDFEHVITISGVNSWLPDYKVGVGFRNSNVEQVGDSIYLRNRNLVYALFVLLLVMLILLFRTARRMVKLSRLKTEFVANVSHEIKTPLASIRLASDTLRLGRARTDEQRQTVMSIISKETDRLQYLVETLLDFSQLEAGKKKYRREAMSVADWWQHVATFAYEKYGDFLGEVDGEAPDARISVDKRALEQVVNILMDNAIKYSPEHKQIDLRIRRGKATDRIRVEVRDYGIGIAKENQALIFDKFVRLGKTDVHDTKGYGIGLSIAKAIIKDHGGRIGVESEVGKGSTFYFEIPLIEEEDE